MSGKTQLSLSGFRFENVNVRLIINEFEFDLLEGVVTFTLLHELFLWTNSMKTWPKEFSGFVFSSSMLLNVRATNYFSI